MSRVFAGLSAAGLATLWAITPEPRQLPVALGDIVVPLALIGLALALLIASIRLFASRERAHAALGLFMVLLTPLALLWAQRYTVMGVSILGGASYWAARASAAPSPDVALEYLRVPLAVPYGRAVTTSAIRSLDQPAHEARLFTLLANDCPLGYWKAWYTFQATGSLFAARRVR